MELSGRKALVTGAGARLGRAFAEALGGAGCAVALHYRGSQGGAAEAAREIANSGGKAALLQADLTSPAECARLVAQARSALDGLDVLVNSAAIFLPGGLLQTSLEDWDRQLALNLRAPFLLAQALVAGLREGERAKIVNVTDARVQRAGVDHLAYRAAKAGLTHLTAQLARELAPRITVNAIAPGALLPGPDDDAGALSRRVAASVPLGVAGGVGPAVEALLFLLREDFLTGVVLPVDGGEYL